MRQAGGGPALTGARQTPGAPGMAGHWAPWTHDSRRNAADYIGALPGVAGTSLEQGPWSWRPPAGVRPGGGLEPAIQTLPPAFPLPYPCPGCHPVTLPSASGRPEGVRPPCRRDAHAEMPDLPADSNSHSTCFQSLTWTAATLVHFSRPSTAGPDLRRPDPGQCVRAGLRSGSRDRDPGLATARMVSGFNADVIRLRRWCYHRPPPGHRFPLFRQVRCIVARQCAVMTFSSRSRFQRSCGVPGVSRHIAVAGVSRLRSAGAEREFAGRCSSTQYIASCSGLATTEAGSRPAGPPATDCQRDAGGTMDPGRQHFRHFSLLPALQAACSIGNAMIDFLCQCSCPDQVTEYPACITPLGSHTLRQLASLGVSPQAELTGH